MQMGKLLLRIVQCVQFDITEFFWHLLQIKATDSFDNAQSSYRSCCEVRDTQIVHYHAELLYFECAIDA